MMITLTTANMNKLIHLISHTCVKSIALFMFFMMMIFSTYAQTPGVAVAPVAESVSLWSSPLFWVYAFAIISLLLVIVAIGSVLVGLVNNKLSEKIGKGAGLILLLILFAYQPANAQTTTLTNTTTQAVIGGLDPNTIIVLSVVVFIELFVILYLYSILQHMLVSLGYKSATEFKWSWSAIMKRMTKSVPLERESEVATDHNYDGIVELDNSLPPWWVYMFYATILFSVVYIAYYQFGAGPTQLMEYDNAIAQAKIEKTAMLKRTASNVDENSVVALTDATDILKGKSSYITKCAACHGQNGEGGVGPNLTDEFWIHGGGVKNIFKTIKYGVQEKGMIAWQAQMQPTEMQQVVSFILTLKGTNPANAKAPQGNLYKEEAVTVDSTSNTHASDSTIVASAQ